MQTTLHALGTLSFQLMPLDISFHCTIVPLKVMLVRPLQPEKARAPMLVTLSGIVMLASPVQPSKAESPMLVTLSGIVTLVRLVQPLKAHSVIIKVPSLITIEVLFGIVPLYLKATLPA